MKQRASVEETKNIQGYEYCQKELDTVINFVLLIVCPLNLLLGFFLGIITAVLILLYI